MYVTVQSSSVEYIPTIDNAYVVVSLSLFNGIFEKHHHLVRCLFIPVFVTVLCTAHCTTNKLNWYFLVFFKLKLKENTKIMEHCQYLEQQYLNDRTADIIFIINAGQQATKIPAHKGSSLTILSKIFLQFGCHNKLCCIHYSNFGSKQSKIRRTLQ